MADQNKPDPSGNKNISIIGDVKDSAVFIGDNNTVNQTIIQKFFNIFKSDSETLEHRNRRILLGHVENAWIKGVLDASLHGAALLDLGIKQDLEAVTQYPWAIKKESTDETLPAGTSMLEIFDSIGMGRSLLILGAPGSGKTTMLLELARQLIAHAREDVTQPIPMVFNLASWTEKLTLADWLAQELNNLYSVPRKTAPDWVKGNKLLLLLDGLDEVRQDSRAKCVEAINAFRKEHGLTSLAVCSRSQDYADLKAKLSFEGAIEVQPLTQKQITEFFNRFGKEMAGIKQVLKKDGSLREMAETPLFLSIMIMAYRDKRDVDIWVSKDEKAQRKHLFDTYIECMFDHPRSKNVSFERHDVLHWLSWLGQKMSIHNVAPYLLEIMQPNWLNDGKKLQQYVLACRIIIEIPGLLTAMMLGVMFGLMTDLKIGLVVTLLFVLLNRLNTNDKADNFSKRIVGEFPTFKPLVITTIDTLSWNWNKAKQYLIGSIIVGLVTGIFFELFLILMNRPVLYLRNGLFLGLILAIYTVLLSGLNVRQVEQVTYPEQRLTFTANNLFFVSLFLGLAVDLLGWMLIWLLGLPIKTLSSVYGLIGGLLAGLAYGGLTYGGFTLVQHYTLRFILARNNLLPWRLVPFLDHCVDLIFLRRVGGGYIFVHRLLMEHFAEMYVEKVK